MSPTSGTRFAEGPQASPGFLLWHLTLSWQRTITQALQPLGLTHVQFVLLACTWWLSDRGEDPRQVDVAAQAGTDVRMTSEVVRKLEQKGLLERTVDPHDTRARRLRLTRTGTAVTRRAVRVVEDVDAAYFAAGSTAEILAKLAGGS